MANVQVKSEVVESYELHDCYFEITFDGQHFRVIVTEQGPTPINPRVTLATRWHTVAGARAGVLRWLEADNEEAARILQTVAQPCPYCGTKTADNRHPARCGK